MVAAQEMITLMDSVKSSVVDSFHFFATKLMQNDFLLFHKVLAPSIIENAFRKGSINQVPFSIDTQDIWQKRRMRVHAINLYIQCKT